LIVCAVFFAKFMINYDVINNNSLSFLDKMDLFNLSYSQV